MATAKLCGHVIRNPNDPQDLPDYCHVCAPKVEALRQINPEGEIAVKECDAGSHYLIYYLTSQEPPRFCPDCQKKLCPECGKVQFNRFASDYLNPVAGICEYCLLTRHRAEIEASQLQVPHDLLGQVIYQAVGMAKDHETSSHMIGVPIERWVVIDKRGISLLVVRLTLQGFGLFRLGKPYDEDDLHQLTSSTAARLKDALESWQWDVEMAKKIAQSMVDDYNRQYHPEQTKAVEPEVAEMPF